MIRNKILIDNEQLAELYHDSEVLYKRLSVAQVDLAVLLEAYENIFMVDLLNRLDPIVDLLQEEVYELDTEFRQHIQRIKNIEEGEDLDDWLEYDF